MKKIILALLLLFTQSFLFSQTSQLIVFTSKNSQNSAVLDFNKNYLKTLEGISENAKIEFKTQYLEDGIPNDIDYLPSIYFIKDGIRHQYKGRYSTTEKVKAFIQKNADTFF